MPAFNQSTHVSALLHIDELNAFLKHTDCMHAFNQSTHVSELLHINNLNTCFEHTQGNADHTQRCISPSQQHKVPT
jgi:hypothetical protein